MISFIGILWAIVVFILGRTVPGWASMTCIFCFIGGIQLISLGVLGEYIGKIYMETKARPRYIISDRTGQEREESCRADRSEEPLPPPAPEPEERPVNHG